MDFWWNLMYFWMDFDVFFKDFRWNFNWIWFIFVEFGGLLKEFWIDFWWIFIDFWWNLIEMLMDFWWNLMDFGLFFGLFSEWFPRKKSNFFPLGPRVRFASLICNTKRRALARTQGKKNIKFRHWLIILMEFDRFLMGFGEF